MEVESVLVTGANKGIGLEFVRQLVNLPKPPRHVFATYRKKDTIQVLEGIKKTATHSKITLIKMDITKAEDIKGVRKVIEETVGDKGLNLLINNAGVANASVFPDITEENLLLHFRTNTIGPVMVFQEILPLLQKSASLSNGLHMSVSRAAVLNISSTFGSIASVGNVPLEQLAMCGYGTSKAALNMVMRMTACVVKDHGILVVNMCPGWVKTDMGTEIAELEPSESISSMLNTLSRLDESHHGTFMDRKGVTIPY